MVTHQLQVERRTGKVRRPETDVLPLCHATTSTITTNTVCLSVCLSVRLCASRYHKKHSPTHTHPDHQTSSINFLHLLRSIASSLFNLRARQSFPTISLQVFFRLPLGLGPSTSCSSSPNHRLLFATCPYHRSESLNVSAVVPMLGLCHLFLISLSAPYNYVSEKVKAHTRLSLLSARPAVNPATLKRATTSFAA